ncbi:MAG TPA: glycoside hydrolase family 2 TIM barrel-domain containing protein [Verrucomicrobiae bacterium]|nr:glycoside hydrolase family 2 TIM barrel-domain containing protein [Verrucomicrobiae bacterium]
MIRLMRNPLVFFLTFIVSLHAVARESTLLDSGWRFMRGDPAGLAGQATNPAAVNWNDADWQTISIPHCWGWEGAQAGKTDYYRGPGWYRRELDVTPEKGKRYFVKFDAAGSVADVYLNGQTLGQHRGAFGAFCFEITKQLSATGTNVLALRVSNAVEPDVAPLSGDFPVYGGLYRDAHLIETAAENFTPADHGSPGVAWLQTDVSRKRAVLDVIAQISNGTAKTQHLALVATVLDANGKKVASTEQPIMLGSNVTGPYSLRVTVPKPHLWNGRPDPYLYKAVVDLRATNNALDSVEQEIGLRFYRVDPTNGFFLNGKPYHLHGVDKHQDRLDKGWAVSNADLDEDMALIKEIGATVIRCAHYQHSDYFYSLCDRAGILVWAEIPQVDKIAAGDKFEETSQSQLRDLIRQNINHPSIFAWSLFNELRLGNPDPHRELQDLNIVAHGEDPTRPTIAATLTDKLPAMDKIPDLLGWNIYPGWYSDWGDKDGVGKMLDGYRYTSRAGGFCVSEYGAGANVTQHEQNPKQPRAAGQWHPEEWQAIVHETDWAALKQRPWVWGTFVWNMFDFVVASRHEGGVVGRNDKGLVTFDRKTRKDAFYFYKANWSDEPVLYITSRRFVERTNAVTDVKIYSNAKQAELFVNGQSQGTRPNDGNAVFIWKNVKLSPGENKIEARATRNRQALSDGCVWTLK